MGEGLHLLPGMGHSDGHSFECAISSQTALSHDHFCHHHSVLTSPLEKSSATNSAVDCAICKYFAQAKPLLLAVCVELDYLVLIDRVAVLSPLLESWFEGPYHSRAPPFCPFNA